MYNYNIITIFVIKYNKSKKSIIMAKMSKVKRKETLRLISYLENQTRGEDDKEKVLKYRKEIAELRKILDI